MDVSESRREKMKEIKEEMIGIIFPIIGAMILLLGFFSTALTFYFINSC
jgi:hypothetical protein